MTSKRNTVLDGAASNRHSEPAIASPGEFADQAYDDSKQAPVDETLLQLKAQYGTVYVIDAEDHAGNPLKMYLRKPDYNVRKGALAAIMSGTSPNDINALTAAGDIVLAGCYIGGDNLLHNDDTRLEASMQAAELVEMNNSIKLKKN
jgi:hypothetical protein